MQNKVQINTRRNEAFFKFRDDQDSSDEEEVEVNKDDFTDRVKRAQKPIATNAFAEYQSKMQQNRNNSQGTPIQQIPQLRADKSPSSGGQGQPNAKTELKEKTKEIAEVTSYIALTVLLQLLVNIFLTYPFIIVKSIYTFFTGFVYPFQKKCTFKAFVKKCINPIVQIMFSISVLNVCFETVNGFLQDRDFYNIWYFDAFFLFFTKILIFTIIKLSKQEDLKFTFKNVCAGFDPGSQNGLVLDLINKPKETDIYMDIPRNDKRWRDEYLNVINTKLEVDLKSQRFNTIQNQMKNPLTLELIGFQFFQGSHGPLSPHIFQFLVTQSISLLKIFCCFGYIFHQTKFSQLEILNIVTITLFNINEIYCLNFLLSNQDLRRKTIISNNLNDVVKYTDIDNDLDYSKKLDITSCISLETWDNCRRALYLFFQNTYSRLEMCYCCIFLYYIFVINICIASYFELYFVFDSDSVFLHPLIVISSTFNFLLLSTFLLFRFYFGSKYNDTIEESSQNIDTLIGIYQDLIQMYDSNFSKVIPPLAYQIIGVPAEPQTQAQVVRAQGLQFEQEDYRLCSRQLEQDPNLSDITCYDLIIAKTKILSRFYIEKRIEFQGRIFTFHDEKVLQQRMMKNIMKSLQRIKSQIEIDQKQLGYKVFNVVQLEFVESLLTLCLGLITILPEVIPKALTLYSESI